MTKRDIRWIIRIVVSSIVLAMVFSLLSTTALQETGYLVAAGLLLVFIFVGILFDMVGVAVTAADETPFHSMAAHKGRGAKEAISLIKNAQRVSSFCNDVVGDIAGIISGAGAAGIATRLVADFSLSHIAIYVALSGFVVGLTIGGKAIGKSIAIGSSTRVVLFVARILYRKNWLLSKLFGRGAR